ncbi:MAG TPA: carbamoyltransferase HypF [Clostridia bacterium]|nr:carbamoyltransferase HypF [Clostridia bacterium]
MKESGNLFKATIRITGIVQGVGFRPFVARLADEFKLCGFVKNQSGHVLIEAVGSKSALEGFYHCLSERRPTGSYIADISIALSPAADEVAAFTILPSDEGSSGAIMPSPDIAICDHCLKELFTAGDPRYLNPFISCTNCGPRFSIVTSIPYDRKSTSMDVFPMCSLCASEYKDPKNRRFHAQTVCCNACGPTLSYTDRNGVIKGGDALKEAKAALNDGKIIAVKGIGGYHLASSPYRLDTVKLLRALKGREQKPFAVMFPDLNSIKEHTVVSEKEAELLNTSARPIVLLERKPSRIVKDVYGNSRYMGAFLPYTPLHHLLLKDTGPIVLTSANPSGLPIFKDDADMFAFFEDNELISGVLWHDREIIRRLDDSVAAVVNDTTNVLRRARGYVPFPTALKGFNATPSILCTGAQEKSAFCLIQNGFAYVSAEASALDTLESVFAYENAVADFEQTLRITPEAVACDLHPHYESTLYAKKRNLPIIYVQHHYAHIASVMAEHSLKENVLGAAFDGTGYGEDNTIWGGEFILVQNGEFSRIGHLKPIKLFSSDESVRQAWKSTLCYLYDAGLIEEAKAHAYGEHFELISTALKAGINTILSSSMGRAFDAASSVLNICHESDYDGQSAIELENAAALYQKENSVLTKEPLPYLLIEDASGPIIDLAPTFAALHMGKKQNESANKLAYRFHLTVCAFTRKIFQSLREKTGIATVALSGGVFQNRLLTEILVPMLERDGFKVYRNEAYPAGDGCLPLGQGYMALTTLNNKKG